jgi:hypothetical protein
MTAPDLDHRTLAKAWIAFTSELNPESGSISEQEYAILPEDQDWAVDLLARYAQSSPEQAYRVILEVVSLSQDAWILTNIAAGPLETILRSHATVFIPRLVQDAAQYPALRALPPHVWISDMAESLRRELDALAGVRQS